MRVLVVEDEESSRYLLEAILHSHGYDVVSAVDGEDGLLKASESAPDLVLTDILMPRMDGYKMCVRLRSDPETREIPIMVYTASFGDPADRRFALSIGVDTFLIKPQEPDVILAEVERLLHRSSAAEREAVEPEDSAMLTEYADRISNKLYEKLLELERSNESLHETTDALSAEVDAKNELVEELSRSVAKEQRAEEALLVSQERYAAAIRGANDGIWDWDLDSERAREWQDAGLTPIRVSVNISTHQFAQRGLLDTVREVLHETGLAPEYLTLEVTESVVMAEPQEAAIVLSALHGLGVGLSVDDFGTGYSSLSYLKKFPFTTLKIDRSFVMDIPEDPDDMTIVEAVVGLAHSLKMSVVAEGVETLDQVLYLRSLGCDEAQGFFISKPVPASEFRVMLARGRVLLDGT